jgi:hypothetical protein
MIRWLVAEFVKEVVCTARKEEKGAISSEKEKFKDLNYSYLAAITGIHGVNSSL